MFLNLVSEDRFSDQMVSFPQGSVVCDMWGIWLLFKYVPCYLSCSIYLLSNVLWCAQTSNLSTSQSAVCRWSVTKIDEGHSSANGKGQGGLFVSAPHVPPSTSLTLHPSLHPSLCVADKQWLRTEAFFDQHGQMDNRRSKRRRKEIERQIKDKYDQKKTLIEICWERNVEAY